MVKQNYGRVIHIGSCYAKMGGGPLAYSAGKHGLIGMMRAMVYQIPPAITVNVLCPGWTDTKLANDYFEGAAATLGMPEGWSRSKLGFGPAYEKWKERR